MIKATPSSSVPLEKRAGDQDPHAAAVFAGLFLCVRVAAPGFPYLGQRILVGGAQWSAKQSIDRYTAGILKHQRHTVVVVRQRDWSRRPVSVKFGFERIFVFKPLDATERDFFRGSKQDRRQAVAGTPLESDVSLAQRRECVAQELLHEDLLPGELL
jgi:hypothetical protein